MEDKLTLGLGDEVDLHEAHVAGGQRALPGGAVERGVRRGQVRCKKGIRVEGKEIFLKWVGHGTTGTDGDN